MATLDNSEPKPQNVSATQVKGSGSDRNSDTKRLESNDNRLDKTNEDSFPASDAPNQSRHREAASRSLLASEMLKRSEAKADIARQNEY